VYLYFFLEAAGGLNLILTVHGNQGYAYMPQTDTGLHMRQRSRAFIIAEASNATNRVVFINAG
jgi:hypothetical protein